MPQSTQDELERRTLRKVLGRLVPFMILAYILNYLDRTNIGFAALHFKQDLGFDDAIYGWGTGIFFWGYFLFEVPSNLIMERVGARRWMARIMITWGLITMALAYTRGPMSFYGLRFLLGVAEAGFFPGLVLYLTYWVPKTHRARALATCMTSTAIAGVLGSIIGGQIMTRMAGVMDMKGWQWLFLLEGFPSVLLGFFVLMALTDRPSDAKWLQPDEREWLSKTLERERAEATRDGNSHGFTAALKQPGIWILSAIYFLLLMGYYGINFWLPKIIEPLYGPNPVTIGWVSTIPFLAAGIGMVLIGKHSDATGERRWHAIATLALGAVGYAIAMLELSPAMTLLGLSIASVGIWGTLGTFWSLSTDYLSPAAAAGGIAFINSVGNLGGGFLGPVIMGQIKNATNSFVYGLILNAICLALGAALVLLLSRHLASPTKKKTP